MTGQDGTSTSPRSPESSHIELTAADAVSAVCWSRDIASSLRATTAHLLETQAALQELARVAYSVTTKLQRLRPTTLVQDVVSASTPKPTPCSMPTEMMLGVRRLTSQTRPVRPVTSFSWPQAWNEWWFPSAQYVYKETGIWATGMYAKVTAELLKALREDF